MQDESSRNTNFSLVDRVKHIRAAHAPQSIAIPAFEHLVCRGGVSFKDDGTTMEVPVFSLATKEDLQVWRYVSEDGKKAVEVAPSIYGRATQHDKDVLIYRSLCSRPFWRSLNVGPMPVPNDASFVRPAPRRICGRSSALQRATSLPFSLGQGALPPTSSQCRLPLHEVVSRVGTLCLEPSKLLHILTIFLFLPAFLSCNNNNLQSFLCRIWYVLGGIWYEPCAFWYRGCVIWYSRCAIWYKGA